MSAFQHVSFSAFGLMVSAFCFFLFVGCSPSLDDAKLVLQQRIATESQGHIKLVSFSKTDLKEFQAKGVPGRRLSYAADIEFDANGVWSRWVDNPTLLNFEFAAVGSGQVGAVAVLTRDLQGHREMGKGDRIRIVGVMTGTKTEKGWKYDLNKSHTTD